MACKNCTVKKSNPRSTGFLKQKRVINGIPKNLQNRVCQCPLEDYDVIDEHIEGIPHTSLFSEGPLQETGRIITSISKPGREQCRVTTELTNVSVQLTPMGIWD